MNQPANLTVLMFTREHMQSNAQNSSLVIAAKRDLKANGWSYRRAAPVLGVTYQHLCEVLNGRRQSARLVRRVGRLAPARKVQR